MSIVHFELPDTDRGTLGAAVDLNTVNYPGNYYCAGSGSNPNSPPLPTGPFILEVQSVGSYAYVQQRATCIAQPTSFAVREYSATAWSAWQYSTPSGAIIQRKIGQRSVTASVTGVVTNQVWFNYGLTKQRSDSVMTVEAVSSFYVSVAPDTVTYNVGYQSGVYTTLGLFTMNNANEHHSWGGMCNIGGSGAVGSVTITFALSKTGSGVWYFSGDYMSWAVSEVMP